MTLPARIRAIEAAKMKRNGATLGEIARFWNPDKPLTRQRLSQLVKRGELLLLCQDSPLYLHSLDRDIPITEEIALRLGLSSRLARLLDNLNLTARELDEMLNKTRHVLISKHRMGVKSFNELAVFFGRMPWRNKFLGKSKYQGAIKNP